VRRLARAAGIETWQELPPHSPRHSAITFALDAGAALRDVQDYARHKDPRTTRRYDHSRGSLDRNAAYTGCHVPGIARPRARAEHADPPAKT
jgi:integrase/recombinase XerD